MKILFFIESLRAGGKERRLTELLKVLCQNPEVDCELAVMNTQVHYQDIYSMGIKMHFLIRRTKKDLFIVNSFYKVCKEFRPDIIHCWDAMTTIYAIPTSKLLKIKLINGMIFNAPPSLRLFEKTWIRARVTFPFSDVIVGNSKAGLEVYHAPVGRSYCIYNGFNFQRIRQLSDKSELLQRLNIQTPYVVGMVASYAKNKDYNTYIAAAQLLLESRKDVTFLAIGENTDSEELSLKVLPELKSHFRLLGKLNDTESYMNLMDVCVLATFTEGISNSILEYMALGKPVVATLGGGTNELVADQETGFLVTHSNALELARRLDALLNDAEMRESMGKAARKRIERYFSIDKMVISYLTLYRSIL